MGGVRRRFRFLAICGPNLIVQQRIVALLTSIPR
jgi:hypothetical protein